MKNNQLLNPSTRPSRFKRRILTAAVAALAVSPAVAQQATNPAAVLPKVQVTGTAEAAPLVNMEKPAQTAKLKVPVHEIPASISVINEEFIRDSGAKNIQDALLYTAGVYAGRYGFDTRGDWAAVRGLNVSAYQDGLRSIYGFYNNARTEVYGLEQIEVLKGPSSALYGQAELGGIINAVSKKPKAEQQGELWAQVGSYDRAQLAGDVTGPLDTEGKWLYRVVAMKRQSGTQVDYVDDDAMLLAPSLTWRPIDGTEVTLLLNHQEIDSKVSSQFLPQRGTLDPAPRGQIDPSTFAGEPGWDRYDTDRDDVTLLVNQSLNENWNVAFAGRHTRSKSETREIYTAVGQIPTDNGDIHRTIHMADRSTDVKSFDLRLEGNLNLGVTHHTLAIGFDYQEALWEESNYLSTNTFILGLPIFNVYNPVYGTIPFAVLTPGDRADNELDQQGFYLIDHIEIGKVVFSATLRQDHVESTILNPTAADFTRKDREISKHFGLMYKFENGISPYVSYTDAFVPNLGTTLSGASLDPTTGEQHEAGIKYLSAAQDLSVAFAWFDIEQDRRVVAGATPEGVRQTGATVDGWELEIKKQWGGLELMANYTDIDTYEEVLDARLSAIAEKMASAWAQYEMANGLRVGIGVRYLGEVFGSNDAPRIAPVTLYDAMIGYAWNNWDFSLNGQNLGDKTYVSWCRAQNSDCGYGELRSWSGNVRYKF